MTPSVFKYVVLRLAPDFMRGESINVGIALFPPEGGCSILFLANQKKIADGRLKLDCCKNY